MSDYNKALVTEITKNVNDIIKKQFAIENKDLLNKMHEIQQTESAHMAILLQQISDRFSVLEKVLTSQTSTSVRRASSSSTTNISIAKKFPATWPTWLKNNYTTLKNNYVNAELQALITNEESVGTAKGKAKINTEITYVVTHIKANPELKKKLEEDYAAAKKAFEEEVNNPTAEEKPAEEAAVPEPPKRAASKKNVKA